MARPWLREAAGGWGAGGGDRFGRGLGWIAGALSPPPPISPLLPPPPHPPPHVVQLHQHHSGGSGAAQGPQNQDQEEAFRVPESEAIPASKPILSVLMWGVNHMINELSQVPVPVMLMPDDFKAYSKIKVDNHVFNKENLSSRFKFKEYCPMVFRNLRERFGTDGQNYQNSMMCSAPINSDNQGRCGTRFLTTYDWHFVIKTMSSEDVAEMHNILKKYHQFIVECHGLGMYRLTVDDDIHGGH